ncbi:hypothetical protein SNEBB_005723 [Seison nebaliae]|nr:hypothetical protein SNEBB_005723 [Seison nebaliae]
MKNVKKEDIVVIKRVKMSKRILNTKHLPWKRVDELMMQLFTLVNGKKETLEEDEQHKRWTVFQYLHYNDLVGWIIRVFMYQLSDNESLAEMEWERFLETIIENFHIITNCHSRFVNKK